MAVEDNQAYHGLNGMQRLELWALLKSKAATRKLAALGWGKESKPDVPSKAEATRTQE